MKRDRRRNLHRSEGWRRSDRIADYREVWWRQAPGEPYRCGWLVEWSAHGIAMLVERADAPAIGAVISPKRRPDLRSWTREAAVRRVEPLSGLLTLVAAEYVAPARRSSFLKPPRSLKPDRREAGREVADRRRSIRWLAQTPVRWHVHRGRRLREALMVERSLEGVVLRTSGENCMTPGTRICAASNGNGGNRVFRSAVVRRVERPSAGEALLFAEIERQG